MAASLLLWGVAAATVPVVAPHRTAHYGSGDSAGQPAEGRANRSAAADLDSALPVTILVAGEYVGRNRGIVHANHPQRKRAGGAEMAAVRDGDHQSIHRRAALQRDVVADGISLTSVPVQLWPRMALNESSG
jgi:hypothetical protein